MILISFYYNKVELVEIASPDQFHGLAWEITAKLSPRQLANVIMTFPQLTTENNNFGNISFNAPSEKLLLQVVEYLKKETQCQ